MSQLMTESGGYMEVEPRVFHHSGNIVQVHARASLVRSSQGAPSHFVVHVEDITSRQRAKAELEESENRFRIMADCCPAMMWVSNAEGEVQFINRAYAEFLGITVDQVVGQRWQPLVHPEDAPAYAEAIQRKKIRMVK